MTVTLLISTYNWPEALELVFESVLRQTRLPDQIVIADDGSNLRTKILIDSYAIKLPIDHIWQEDLGFRKSLILNKSISACTSDYIIEVDGDIVLNRHFIQDHINAAEEGYFVQGCRAMLGEELTQRTLSSPRFKFNAFTKGMVTRFNAIRLPHLSFLFKTNPYSSHNVKGCNMAFWKEDYVRINGYFNGFEGWGWEDYEFAERLINSGIKKKKLKFAAIGYHLYHKLSSRTNFRPNELIYEETVQKKIWHRSPGFHEVAM